MVTLKRIGGNHIVKIDDIEVFCYDLRDALELIYAVQKHKSRASL